MSRAFCPWRSTRAIRHPYSYVTSITSLYFSAISALGRLFLLFQTLSPNTVTSLFRLLATSRTSPPTSLLRPCLPHHQPAASSCQSLTKCFSIPAGAETLYPLLAAIDVTQHGNNSSPFPPFARHLLDTQNTSGACIASSPNYQGCSRKKQRGCFDNLLYLPHAGASLSLLHVSLVLKRKRAFSRCPT
ncbi:hypothetical protein K431DRAFT_19098 [Polychaeton citri CBS 116435]|uniref:Uncharacterized protein n=1 Tax=Polychaeton citri CBS 116435 TaxID=1314669 RepID=A0A9P4UJI0_9PEZI|nr:hypothetical protein K431DRAFT_19098 [Polychaeton citri CBS 116435]